MKLNRGTALGQLWYLRPRDLKVLLNKNGYTGAAKWHSGTLSSYSGYIQHPVSYTGWLAKEKEGKLTVLFQRATTYIPAVTGKPVTFLPTDAQFTHIAALLKNKQVDSLYKYQGHQVSKKRKNVLHMPNPKWLLHFFFRLNFAASTQMWLSAEGGWRATRDWLVFPPKRQNAHQGHSVPWPSSQVKLV